MAYPYQQNYMNPYSYQQYPQYQQTNQNGMIWVNSDMEAAQYLVSPNSAVTLWNANAPVVYLKQTDASGKPSMKIYDLVERAQNASVPSPAQAKEFVTREDFDALAAKVAALAKEDEE